MRSFRRKKFNNKKILFLLCISSIAIFMSIGYSILSQQLNIRGTANLFATDKYLWHKITTDYLTTSGSGFYENTYENNKYSYVGNGNTNYIMFNNELWRIVSVEADNTIKITKPLELGVPSCFHCEANQGTYCPNTNGYTCNAWGIKSIFTNGTITGTVEQNATLHNTLDNYFQFSIATESQNMVAEHSFNVGSVASGATLEAAMASEMEQTWTGKMGLLTISEMLYPTNIPNMIIGTTTYSDNYLLEYTQPNKSIWTITPEYNNSLNVWIVSSDPTFPQQQSTNYSDLADIKNAMMALYLKDTIEYVSGNGNIDNPFIIK